MKNTNSDGETIGYLFTLKKRMQKKNRNDNRLYSFLTYGFYDGLEVSVVKKWYQFRPKGIEQLKIINSLEVPFIDQYTIKTVRPGIAEELKCFGINCDIWNDPQNYSDFGQFISLVSIHVSEVFIKHVKNLDEIVRYFANKINTIAKEMDIDLEALNCGIFPSLGYSDIIVTFLCDGYNEVSCIVDQLKSSTYKNYIVISSCYTVSGISNEYKYRETGKESSFSVISKVILKEGVSYYAFNNEFNKKIVKDLCTILGKKESELDRELESKITCSAIFGNADIIIKAEMYQTAFLYLFHSPYLFNPSNQFYKEYISDIRTTISTFLPEKMKCEKTGRSNIKGLDNILDSKKRVWEGFINKLEKKFLQEVYPSRNSKALQTMMKNFINVAYPIHGFDMRRSILPVFDSFIFCMEKIMEEENQTRELKEYSLQALNIFRDKVGDFLLNLIRSDKPFIEGNSLLHPSIGSATKLLFAYTGILQRITKIYNDKITFLVMSGGTDRIVATDLFDFYPNVDNNKPVMISVPEMSLYDFKGTLFRLLHECMHFCGKRERKERYIVLKNCIADYISKDIPKMFYKRRFKNHLDNIKIFCDEEQYSQLDKKVKEIKQSAELHLESDIKEVVKTSCYFLDYEYNSRELYFINLTSDKIKTAILSPKNMANNFWKCIENSLKEIVDAEESSYAEKIIKQIDNCGIDYSALKLFKIGLDLKEKDDIFIKEYYKTLFSSDAEKTRQQEDIYSYKDRLKMCQHVLQESFSDVCAASILDMKVEDFLLSFIYDKKPLDNAMPDTLDNAMRMGADLKVLYKIEERLPEGVKKKVRDKEKHWKEKGFEYRYVEDLIVRIDGLLQDYQLKECRIVSDKIEAYLEMCKEKNNNEKFVQLRQIYPKCDLNKQSDLNDVMDFVIKEWMNKYKE